MSSILFPGFQRFLLRERYRFSPGSGPKETGSQHRLGAYVVVSLLAGSAPSRPAALATWLRRWQPIHIHDALLAGALSAY